MVLHELGFGYAIPVATALTGMLALEVRSCQLSLSIFVVDKQAVQSTSCTVDATRQLL